MPGLIPIPLPGMIIRFASYLFSSAMRKYYTRQKLAQLVEIQVSSEPPGITVNCSELPNISAWIEFTNTSPFHVTIHEFEAELYLPDRVAKFVKICNRDIAPSTKERLLIETDLTVKQVNFIERHMTVDDPRLKISSMLNCGLSSFEINEREISAKSIKFINCDDSPEMG